MSGSLVGQADVWKPTREPRVHARRRSLLCHCALAKIQPQRIEAAAESVCSDCGVHGGQCATGTVLHQQSLMRPATKATLPMSDQKRKY